MSANLVRRNILLVFKQKGTCHEVLFWSVPEIQTELQKVLAEDAKKGRTAFAAFFYIHIPFFRKRIQQWLDGVPSESALRRELNRLCKAELLVINRDYTQYAITKKGRNVRFPRTPPHVAHGYSPTKTPPSAA